jgi:hypothetical protein
MGTSASSRGPGSGVPLVPEWVAPTPGQSAVAAAIPATPSIALPGRFGPARSRLGDYGRSGSQQSLRRGLGHYTRKGLGGARSAASRMAGTANTAGGLYGVLDALSSGSRVPSGIALDPAGLAGRTQTEIADLITDALRPTDGTQDTEAARDSVARALAELLEIEPAADLTNLSQPHIEFVVEAYIANDLSHRIELDVGKAVLDKAPSYAVGADRLEQMRAYVRQEVARAFRERTRIGEQLDRQTAAKLSSDILRDTFEVFESYL